MTEGCEMEPMKSAIAASLQRLDEIHQMANALAAQISPPRSFSSPIANYKTVVADRVEDGEILAS